MRKRALLIALMLAGSLATMGATAAFADDQSAPADDSLQAQEATGTTGFGLTYVTSSTATTWDGATIDVSWYGDGSATTYHISSAAQLIGLSAITSPLRGTLEESLPTTEDGDFILTNVASNAVDANGSPIMVDLFLGKTVYLDANIDIAGGGETSSTCDWWKPIADANVYSSTAGGQGASVSGSFDAIGWRGIFDGQGHTVSNIYVDGTANDLVSNNFGGYQGFFCAIGVNGVIRNVGTTGYVKGRLNGGICSISMSPDLSALPADADLTWPRIENCWSSCTNVNNGSSSRMSGGIFGGEDRGARMSVNIINCYSSANLSGGQSRGGVAGCANGMVAGCYFYGTIQSAGSNYCGAIVGNLFKDRASVNGVTGAGKGDLVNCFALTGSNLANSALYRYVTATNSTPTLVTDGFVSADTLKASAASLGSAYVADTNNINNGYPILWCQAGLSEISISTASVATIDQQNYTGTALKPVPVVTLDGTALTYGTDYLVSYENNTNVGTATVHIYGVGRYTGRTQDASFEIVATGLSASVINQYNTVYWRYPGDEESAVIPNLYVTDADGNRLNEGVDYVIQCTNNDAAGTATATIVPAEGSSVTGSKSVDFTIVDASDMLQGGGTAEDPYLIWSVYDLQLASHKIQQKDATYAGASYKLMDNVDATPKSGEPELSPLGVYYYSGDTYALYDAPFYGNFDGGGHTITLGMTSASLKNFKLRWWSSPTAVAAVSPYTSAYLSLFSNVKAPSDQAGKTVEIKNLTIDGSLTAVLGMSNASAFVAYSNDVDLQISNCVNKANFYANIGAAENGASASTNTTPFAGFVGATPGATIQSCTNYGTVGGTAPTYGKTAGIVSNWNTKNNLTLIDCHNTANISAGNTVAGLVTTGSGVSGATGTMKLERCSNTGNISATASAAAGLVTSTLSTVGSGIEVLNSFNTGDVTLTGGGYTGGIVAKPSQKGNLIITNCYNTGDIRNTSNTITGSATICAGGILGGALNTGVTNCPYVVTIENCYNIGERSTAWSTSLDRIGNIVGFCYAAANAASKNAPVTATNCYYLDGIGVGPVYATNATAGMTVTDNSTQTTAEAMQAATFPATLGEAFKADGTGESSINGGYPVLTWQKTSEEQESISASVSLGDTQVELGGTFTVDVKMNISKSAFEATLDWNSEELQLVSIAAGSDLVIPDSAGGFENAAGSGYFSFWGNTATDEDVVVATTTFRALKMGQASVGIASAMAGESGEYKEIPVTLGEAQTVTVGKPGLKGDVNNSGTTNIVDAQIAYDLGAGKYAQDAAAQAALLAYWGENAFMAMVEAVADVNDDNTVDASDAFAIQRFVHYGWPID